MTEREEIEDISKQDMFSSIISESKPEKVMELI